MRRTARYAIAAVVAGLIWGASAASAATTPGWICIPTTAGQPVLAGGTGAAPSCSAGTTAALAPTYVASGVGGKPTVVFSSLNVQVLSGSGATDGAVNGVGNLIVGYAENPDGFTRTGSNNLVIGSDNGWSGFGSVIAGYGNDAVGDFESGFISTSATGASISPNPASVTFAGEVPLGTLSTAESVVVTDTGSGSVQLGQVQLAGANSGDFIVAADSCTGAILGAGFSCTVGLRVAPSQAGVRTASLTIPADDASSPLQIPLSAVGSGASSGGGVGPAGPAGAAGATGSAGPTGPAGPAGKAGVVRIVDCTTVKSPNHKAKTRCTTRVARGTVTLTTTHIKLSRAGIRTIRRETVSLG